MIEIAPRITVDPSVRSGKPVVTGTRVPVSLVLGQLAAGMAIDEITEEYVLTREDVYAVLAYAASVISNEEVHALA